MNKKKILNFIEELKTMANNLDDVETAAELTGESSMPAKHYNKTIELPGSVAHITDLYTRKSLLAICTFPAEKSLINLAISHIHNGGTVDLGYGPGFNLNLNERIEVNGANRYYYDALGNKYKASDGKVITGEMIYSEQDPPSWVKQLFPYYYWLVDPVKWIFSGNTVKGYDSNGYLVMIGDTSNNCIVISRNNAKITSIEKYKDNSLLETMSFNYNYEGVHLDNIHCSDGEAKFTYKDGKLFNITLPNSETLKFSYNSNYISKVSSSDGYSSEITHGAALVEVTVRSTKTQVPNGSTSDSLSEINSDKIEFQNNLTIVNGKERYTFNSSTGLLSMYVREENSVVVQAERYEDHPNTSYVVIKALPSTLNKTAYNSYLFLDGESTLTQYNEFGQPKRVVVADTIIKSGVTRKTETNYTYQQITGTYSSLCTKEVTDVTYYKSSGNKTFKYITEYKYYSTTNRPLKKTSYVSGEENIHGKDIQEYGYDVYDNFDSVISYNSLDPSLSLVSECVYDEYGRVKKEKDQRGYYTADYEYSGLSKKPTKETLYNGSSREYEYENDLLKKITFKSGTGSTVQNVITYSDGEVTGYTDGGNALDFNYNSKRRLDKVFFGSNSLKDMSYEDNDDGTVKKMVTTNANGEQFSVTYDNTNCRVTACYNGTELSTITYDMGGKVTSVNDNVRKVVSNYTYDDNVDTLTQVTTGNNTETYEYNDYGAISIITYSGEVTRNISYGYEDTSKMRLTTLYNGAHFVEYGYDSLGRNNKKIIVVNNNEVLKHTISYTAGLNCTTTMPAQISYNIGSSIAYTYDELGNIKKITANNKSIDYTYDKFGRLTREDNQELGKSYIYTYDNSGNITKKEAYNYTTVSQPSGTAIVINYTYSGNKLISFGGESCLYDSIGNPTLYRGKTATWKGGQLQSYNNVAFGYDGLGRRMSKTVNGTKTEYLYDSEDKLLKSTDGMEYFYDETGVIAFKYGGALYIYKKDIQGNINAILDSNGTIVVKYTYDAWGNHTVSGEKAATIGAINPFRYRGYFYDTETKLYFLQTRYYDPEVGRFISPDNTDYADPETIHGLNLYAYCGNNPVMNVDPTGEFVSTILGAIFGAIWGAVSAALNGEDILKGIAAGVVSGALTGLAIDVAMAVTALVPGPLGVVAGAGVAVVLGFGLGTLGDASGQLIKGKEKIDWDQALMVGGITAGTNLLAFGISFGVSSAVGNSTANLFKMVLPSYTPAWSWLAQAILGWTLPFFSIIPALPKFQKRHS